MFKFSYFFQKVNKNLNYKNDCRKKGSENNCSVMFQNGYFKGGWDETGAFHFFVMADPLVGRVAYNYLRRILDIENIPNKTEQHQNENHHSVCIEVIGCNWEPIVFLNLSRSYYQKQNINLKRNE